MGQATSGTRGWFVDPERGRELLRAEPNGQNVLAVLTDSTVDEWHRRWTHEIGQEYAQMAVVETYDLARSTAASTPQTTVVDRNLAVTTVQRPVDGPTLFGVIEQYLEGWAESAADTLLYIESLDAFLDDQALPTLLQTLERILEKATEVGATVRVHFDTETAPALATVRVRERLDDVVGAPIPDSDAVSAIHRLRADDPTNFGYFRRHWRDAMRALDASTRTYPQARQLHDDVTETDTSPRTLGAALTALERLGAISLWGDTVGANRYDLTSYDPERVASLGIAVESLDE